MLNGPLMFCNTFALYFIRHRSKCVFMSYTLVDNNLKWHFEQAVSMDIFSLKHTNYNNNNLANFGRNFEKKNCHWFLWKLINLPVCDSSESLCCIDCWICCTHRTVQRLSDTDLSQKVFFFSSQHCCLKCACVAYFWKNGKTMKYVGHFKLRYLLWWFVYFCMTRLSLFFYGFSYHLTDRTLSQSLTIRTS